MTAAQLARVTRVHNRFIVTANSSDQPLVIEWTDDLLRFYPTDFQFGLLMPGQTVTWEGGIPSAWVGDLQLPGNGVGPGVLLGVPGTFPASTGGTSTTWSVVLEFYGL